MKDNIVYVGIDPGKTGFISIEFNGEYEFFPITEKSGNFDESIFLKIFKHIRSKYEGFEVKVAIEEVGGRGGWSATNNFNFGYIAGMIKSVFILLNVEILMVRPQKWQSYMRQGYPDLKKTSSTGKTQVRDPKAVAQMIVEKEYPEIDFRRTTRARKNDDNKIDSFLIMKYLKRISKI